MRRNVPLPVHRDHIFHLKFVRASPLNCKILISDLFNQNVYTEETDINMDYHSALSRIKSLSTNSAIYDNEDDKDYDVLCAFFFYRKLDTLNRFTFNYAFLNLILYSRN